MGTPKQSKPQAASRWAKALLERPQERQRLSASHSMERCMEGFLLLLLVTLITPMLAQGDFHTMNILLGHPLAHI